MVSATAHTTPEIARSEAEEEMHKSRSFNEVAHRLGAGSNGGSAAECHGFLSGRLCLYRSAAQAAQDYRPALGAATDDRQALLQAWAEDIQQQLDDGQCTFSPFLPDEEAPLGQRTEALRDWCTGFLTGLGREPRQGKIQEFLQDLGHITQMQEVDENAQEEENERALTELIEYVRTGALYLHMELRP